MNFTDQELLAQVSAGDTRAIARLISLSENRVPRARKLQAQLFKQTGRAQVIGVTGSPGAGKSSLVDQLARFWRTQNKKVAVIAIDPTSPFSGGAILGDRIRMAQATEDSGVYVRSMATRGTLGGLSRATLEAVHILDAAGFDIILVETVGVGQAEVDIARTADTCLVVLVPGMGDSVQIFKAGILEIADIFVINKADREGVDLLHKDLRVLISLDESPAGSWTQLIEKTIATTGSGVPELAQAVTAHRTWLQNSSAGKEKRRQIIEHTLIRLATELVYEKTVTAKRELLASLIEECLERRLDPYSAVEKLQSQGQGPLEPSSVPQPR